MTDRMTILHRVVAILLEEATAVAHDRAADARA
jgi:hypothetical protein